MAPMGLARAGGYSCNNGGLGRQSSDAYYWSHRIYSSAGSYYLDFGSGSVSPQYGDRRGYGFSVRCLAR